MELTIGTKVRDKETGAVGVIIAASGFIDLYRVDTGDKKTWLDIERLEVIEEK